MHVMTSKFTNTNHKSYFKWGGGHLVRRCWIRHWIITKWLIQGEYWNRMLLHNFKIKWCNWNYCCLLRWNAGVLQPRRRQQMLSKVSWFLIKSHVDVMHDIQLIKLHLMTSTVRKMFWFTILAVIIFTSDCELIQCNFLCFIKL